MEPSNPTIEHCRHWVDEKVDRCNEPASIIVWGKLFEMDELGPRCSKHWPSSVHEDRLDQYAVFDLRPLHTVTDYSGVGRLVIGQNLPIRDTARGEY